MKWQMIVAAALLPAAALPAARAAGTEPRPVSAEQPLPPTATAQLLALQEHARSRGGAPVLSGQEATILMRLYLQRLGAAAGKTRSPAPDHAP